jgi:hypothetical protein
MVNTKLDNWTKKINEYVEKTEQHFFINKSNEYTKILKFNHLDIPYAIRIQFNENSIYLKIRKMSAKDSNSLNNLKNNLFQSFDKSKSIKNFKKARTLSSSIKNMLEKEYSTEKGYNQNIRDLTRNIEDLIKKENFFEKNLTI